MTEDPATGADGGRVDPDPDPDAVVLAGHRGDETTARAGLDACDPTVRAIAVGALARMGRLEPATVCRALADSDPRVRRRACDEAGRLGSSAGPDLEAAVAAALDDSDPLVVESACVALGELGAGAAVGHLCTLARGHADERCREAAVAALGAIGDPAGKAAVLDACAGDRPSVRRRAVVALAAFDGDDVDTALTAALADRDWQVRQAAEELLAD